MLKKSFLSFKNSFINLSTIPKYYVYKFTHREKLIITEKQFGKTHLGDDLHFEPHDVEGAGGVEKIAEFVRKNPEVNFISLNIAYVMYNLGKYDYPDPVVFEELERHLEKNTENFTARECFGCLYGLYRTNSGSPYAIKYFEELMIKKIGEIKFEEAYEMIIAGTYHKQMKKERVYEYISKHFVPIVLKQWKRLYLRRKIRFQLMERLIEGEYYDEPLWEKLLHAFKTCKNTRSLEIILKLRELLRTVQNSGKFYRDLTPDIEFYTNKIANNKQYEWRYNIKEDRFYTYEELFARREEYNYPEQLLGEYTDEQVEKMRAEAEEEEESDPEEEAREHKKAFTEFNDIIVEKLLKGEEITHEDLGISPERAKQIRGYDDTDDEPDGLTEQQREAQERAQKEKLKREKKIRKREFKEARKKTDDDPFKVE